MEKKDRAPRMTIRMNEGLKLKVTRMAEVMHSSENAVVCLALDALWDRMTENGAREPRAEVWR